MRTAFVVLLLAAGVPAGLAAPAAAAVPAAPGHVVVAEKPGDPVKWYRVRDSYNGEPEYLYEIAERFLGDGDRNPEIFTLNKGRTQPDGGVLTAPEEIEPGWVLQLPTDASGAGVEFGPLPTALPSAPPSAAAGRPAPVSPAAEAGDGGGSALLPVLLAVLGVIVVAAIVLGVVLTRRRRSAPAGRIGAIPRQRTGPPAHLFDTAASWTIDRALRVLVTTAPGDAPPIYAISVDEARIKLRLVIPREHAPEPWEAQDDGRLWVASLRDLQALPADPDARTPCPRLVTLGSLYGIRELVDLGQAPGVIAVQGDQAAGRSLAAAWAMELTGSPWSEGVRVIAGGLGTVVAPGAQVTSLDSVDAALDAAAGEPGGIGVVLLAAPPADLDRIHALATREDAAWAVVVLGHTSLDRWRFTLQGDGRLDTGSLGILAYTPGAAATP
ncbi:peptidoglycan-binding LysM [Actinoplanes sp. N902-109]|nr:peptidoglycan-binding LysM [Actinoplanes sp. N902-109]